MKKLVDLELYVLHETDKAFLVCDDPSDEENFVWVPKSQVEAEEKQRGIYEITMPEWLAMEKGLI